MILPRYRVDWNVCDQANVTVLHLAMRHDKVSIGQEGYIEELSTCFYLDTALLKSSESVLSET